MVPFVGLDFKSEEMQKYYFFYIFLFIFNLISLLKNIQRSYKMHVYSKTTVIIHF